jgi:hypothetical protein
MDFGLNIENKFRGLKFFFVSFFFNLVLKTSGLLLAIHKIYECFIYLKNFAYYFINFLVSMATTLPLNFI